MNGFLQEEISEQDLRSCVGVMGEHMLFAQRKMELEEKAARLGSVITEFKVLRSSHAIRIVARLRTAPRPNAP